MASSSEYKSRMNYYSKKIASCKEEISNYEKLIKKLTKLKGNLPTIKENLKQAETDFLNGGYNDNGETLDRGVLKQNYDKLEIVVSDITRLIANVNSKISDLNSSISSYQDSYAYNRRKYYNALQEESNNV